MKLLSLAILCAASLAAADDLVVFHEAGQSPRAQLDAYLNAIGRQQLDRRKAEIAAIRSQAEAARRRQLVRQKVLALIGGLPNYHGPLNTRPAGTLNHEDYRIEKVIYESLPRFYVTANVYVPQHGAPPFPAVLLPLGHWEGGKEGDRQIAVGLARKGFVVLEYDPIGQGERKQYWDPEIEASRVGGSTDEHSHANGQTLLIGDSVARYRIFDGIRSLDYLLSRKDVDPERIGCTGCSGGGTLTAYISALDDRVKVAATACYINSWEDILPALGPQDGEQSFPRFLAEGLDIADYIETFAPKPYLIASTREDFFPLAGAQRAVDEARRFYTDAYGAQDRISWFVGPGEHGVPPVSREAIFSWFIKWLRNGEGDPHDAPVKLDSPQDILCTPTGQVADSLGGENVYTLNKARAAEVLTGRASVSAADIRAAAAIGIQPGGAAPSLRVHNTYARPGYKIDVVSYESEPGIQIPGLILTPDGAARRPAALVADARPKQTLAAPGGDLEDLVKAGYLVFAIQPRGIAETPQPGRNSILGDYTASARAYVVGKTLVGMRAEDIVRAVDYLCSRPDVDPASILAEGQGILGVPLLHAAVLDRRIGRVVLQDTLASYRLAVDRPVTRGLYDVLIPGVLLKYDLPDLVSALKPRSVTIVNPVDQLGMPLRGQGKYRAPEDPLHEFLP
jgi:cephalosporin-C deacetylase-like acetyl esterase